MMSSRIQSASKRCWHAMHVAVAKEPVSITTYTISTNQSTQTFHRINNYASYLDWRISPLADSTRLHSQRWLTRRSVITRQFVTTGSQLSNALSSWGGNHWTKVHQTRRWPDTRPGLPSRQISSPESTHAGDICYEKICGQRKKQRERNRQ